VTSDTSSLCSPYPHRLFPLRIDTQNNMSKRFSTADVASHKTASDLWIIVDEDVYDLTKFQDEHPGGKKSMSILESKDHPRS
jgi:cytochrome b involved in lipid metabolism